MRCAAIDCGLGVHNAIHNNPRRVGYHEFVSPDEPEDEPEDAYANPEVSFSAYEKAHERRECPSDCWLCRVEHLEAAVIQLVEEDARRIK